jgi:hypothetical protein
MDHSRHFVLARPGASGAGVWRAFDAGGPYPGAPASWVFWEPMDHRGEAPGNPQ